MKISEFDYILPKHLIAQFPEKERDRSRLMVLDRGKRTIEHTFSSHLIDYLKETDTLVLNNTKVIPARLLGKKENTGGRIEALLINRQSDNVWEVLLRPLSRIKSGTKIIFGKGDLIGTIIDKKEDRGVIVFNCERDIYDLLSLYGYVPLPPYIKRNFEDPDYIPFHKVDKKSYQTVYASVKGSVAAPTAGLHFTRKLLQRIREKGVDIVNITLHIGYGTFEPIRVLTVEEHHMDKEFYTIDKSTGMAIQQGKKRGGRIIAVGTTTVRTLETAANSRGKIVRPSGYTDLFIYPGYRFRLVDGLMTNFHLPKSTLLMLVCAFGKNDFIINAYNEAVKREYRFYSFGDAMLIL
jgi:S-adenosylmethionine:tRNA ribosyltransferase-isomerase